VVVFLGQPVGIRPDRGLLIRVMNDVEKEGAFIQLLPWGGLRLQWPAPDRVPWRPLDLTPGDLVKGAEVEVLLGGAILPRRRQAVVEDELGEGGRQEAQLFSVAWQRVNPIFASFRVANILGVPAVGLTPAVYAKDDESLQGLQTGITVVHKVVIAIE